MHFTGFAGAGWRRANTDIPHASCSHHAATNLRQAHEMTKTLEHMPRARSPIVPFQGVDHRQHGRHMLLNSAKLRRQLMFAKLRMSFDQNQGGCGTFVRSEFPSEVRWESPAKVYLC
jgi:hypothetical protein